MRYDKLFARLSNRALDNAGVDLDTFFENAIDVGMSPESVQSALLNDLEQGGPIFGKFLGNLTGAGEASVMQAERQGGDVAIIQRRAEQDAALNEMLGLGDQDWETMVDNADADAMNNLDLQSADRVDKIWISELLNTCEYCLPLHGTVLSTKEWRERGLNPATIHQNLGWNNICHCRLEDVQDYDREDLITPLKRIPQKSQSGLKLGRQTIRSVQQWDIDKARIAQEKASESLIGRRTMRLAGQANRPQPKKGSK